MYYPANEKKFKIISKININILIIWFFLNSKWLWFAFFLSEVWKSQEKPILCLLLLVSNITNPIKQMVLKTRSFEPKYWILYFKRISKILNITVLILCFRYLYIVLICFHLLRKFISIHRILNKLHFFKSPKFVF